MEAKELKEILDKHKKWLENKEGGKRANLQEANLQGAELQGAELQGAELQEANLQGAELQGAHLQGANLRWADLQRAHLQEANLQEANLQGAELQGAHLWDANLDFSCLPLWCGSFDIKVDKRLFSQLLCHIARLDVSECEDEVKKAMAQLRTMPACNWFCEYRGDVEPLTGHKE